MIADHQMDDLMQWSFHQYQDREGQWHSFTGPKHYQATVVDGTWPLRRLHTDDQMREYAKKAVEAERERASQAWFNNHTR